MANLLSDKVNVFPSTKRGTRQLSARLMTESSMVDVVNKLLDNIGFVITPDPIDTQTSTGLNFEFNIYGYYFNVNAASVISAVAADSGKYIKASITLAQAGDFLELQGQDVEIDTDVWSYQGVSITRDDITPTGPYSWKDNNSYYLVLFENVSGSWVVPELSRQKFVHEQATVIDGGEIVESV